MGLTITLFVFIYSVFQGLNLKKTWMRAHMFTVKMIKKAKIMFSQFNKNKFVNIEVTVCNYSTTVFEIIG